MSAVWQIRLSSTFLGSRALPTPAETAFAYERGWLRRQTLVELALLKYQRGMTLHHAEEQLALLLSDELDRVDDLAAALNVSSEPNEERARYWAFIMLAWLWEHQEEVDDLALDVDCVAADLDYLDAVMPLTGLVAVAPDAVGNTRQWEERLLTYIEREHARYRARDASFLTPG